MTTTWEDTMTEQLPARPWEILHSNSQIEFEVRAARAELRILETFDMKRRVLGHDYGCGQRGHEIIRRQRELDRLEALAERRGARPADGEPTLDDISEAWGRIAVPKIRRLRNELYRRETPATRRTMLAWERTAAVFAASVIGAKRKGA